MKRNVDLTANGDFSMRRGIFNLRNLVKINNLKENIYPWTSTYKCTSRENELFFTGNKIERKYKKEYASRDISFCDCCGKRNVKKWDFKYCLCMDCNTRFEEQDRVKKIWILKGYGSNVKSRV